MKEIEAKTENRYEYRKPQEITLRRSWRHLVSVW